MDSSKKLYFKSFDGLRGIAFLTVLLAHIGQQYKSYYIAGKVGVVVFFILSSFLLIFHLLNNPDTFLKIKGWVEYVKKRLLRIYPMYIFVLLLEIYFSGFSFTTFLRHIFLLSSDKHYWTIPVEITFYIIAPILGLFIVMGLKRKLSHMLGFLLFLLLGYGVFFQYISEYFRTGATNEGSFIFYATPFIFGTILAVLQNNAGFVKQISGLSKKATTFILTVVCVVISTSIPHSYKAVINANYGSDFFIIFLFYSVLLSIITLLVINSQTIYSKILESRPLRFVSNVSYSGYLIHALVIDMVYKINIPFFYSTVLIIFLTLFFSSLTHRFIEKPFVKMGKNTLK